MFKKLFIKTHGCQMNEYDSSKMAAVLNKSHGVELTKNCEEADIILFNTCSIREKAQEKVFSELGRLRDFKKKKPHLVIGVGGCVASQEGAHIIKRAPYVDLVFGPQTLHRLPELLTRRISSHKPVIDISFPEIEKFDNLPQPRAEGPTAFVSIMEGCSKYCSYCVVPYTRGEEISRPFDDVLRECYDLVNQGVREINLLGQNVNDYCGTMLDGSKASLALLIRYLASMEKLGRIRFTTSHPLAFSDDLIEAYRDVDKLVNHLHLPVQSGSDKILSLMKRGYTALEFKSKIRKLRKIRPNIRLSTDIIVGFPGETDKDFADTMKLVKDMEFDTSYSFVFSKRPGTPAAMLQDETPLDVKKTRLQTLQTHILANAARFSEQMIGQTHTILVTGIAKKSDQQLTGRTECNRIVNFYADPKLIGQFVPIKITESLRNSLRGEMVT
jgi:tRNA-2-methylthio-N6-dimethylallyladenosine synthase